MDPDNRPTCHYWRIVECRVCETEESFPDGWKPVRCNSVLCKSIPCHDNDENNWSKREEWGFCGRHSGRPRNNPKRRCDNCAANGGTCECTYGSAYAGCDNCEDKSWRVNRISLHLHSLPQLRYISHGNSLPQPRYISHHIKLTRRYGRAARTCTLALNVSTWGKLVSSSMVGDRRTSFAIIAWTRIANAYTRAREGTSKCCCQ